MNLKVKFPQAGITNIRTLPLVFPKCSEQLYDGKIRTAPSDIMYVKLFITEMWAAAFFMKIKMYSQRNIGQRSVQSKKEMYSQRNSVGTDREKIVPGNL